MSYEETDHITHLKSPQRTSKNTLDLDDAAIRERQRRREELQNEAEFFRQKTQTATQEDIEDEIDTHEEFLTTISDLPDPSEDDIYLRYFREHFDLEKVGKWVESGLRSGHLKPQVKLPETSSKRELPVDIDPHDLSQARWGVVCRQDDVEQLETRLAPLLERRSEQQKQEVKFHVVEEGESARTFLARHDFKGGVIQPDVLPYYLLLAAEPEQISFEFQYQLGADRAVGRLAFDDPNDFTRYARAVVEAEKGKSPLGPKATVFSVENEDDPVAPAIREYMSLPLHRRLQDFPGWDVDLIRRDQATKHRLQQLFGAGPEAPGLLLIASHGASVSKDLEDGFVQRLIQGSVICQQEAGSSDRLFTALDVPPEADLTGQIAFLFPCYGGGTPVLDNFPTYRMAVGKSERPDPRRTLTDRAFVARLPQKLLSRGTLATVAHIDRGWLLSFVWSAGGRNISSTASLEDTLLRLLMGERLGHAFLPLRRRANSLAFQLKQVLDYLRDGIPVDPAYLGELWLTVDDARNQVILGDPAVYLRGERRSGELLRLPRDLTERLRNQALAHGETLENWALNLLENHLQRDD